MSKDAERAPFAVGSRCFCLATASEKFAKNEKLGKNCGKSLAKKGKKGYHITIKTRKKRAVLRRKKIMLWNLLSGEAGTTPSNKSSLWIILVFIAVIVLFMIWNRRSQKKREQEINETLDAIQPGNKVKTIGGICGIVVEVCPEDNTFILETGSETSGKSYLKFDKKAVYQTDATAKKEEKPEEAPVEEVAEAPEFEEAAPVEETVEETTVEEAPVENTEE